MARRNLSQIKAKVLAHNRLLKQYRLSLRTRRQWISSYNGVSVALDTLSRWEREDNRTPELQQSDSSNALDWSCNECQGQLAVDQEQHELVCRNCGLVYERFQVREVDLETQIEQYQPTLAFSFNGGVGTPSPESLLRYVVRAANGRTAPLSTEKAKNIVSHKQSKKKTAAYKEYVDVLRLRPFVSGKDQDAKLNAILEHLTKRMRLMFGFDPTSDKDRQFADLNDLARILRQARVNLKGHRFNAKKIVDALLVVVYGDRAREVIERPEKRLRCPRCRRERPYAHDTNPSFIICVKCGKQILCEDARFNVSYSPVDPVYVATIRRLLPTLPSPAEKSYTGHSVIGQVSVEAV